MSLPSPLVSRVTNRVPLEEECLPSFEVLNCLLNLAASCLDDENKIPLKVIASFSAMRFALPSIPLIVLHSLVSSVFWSMFSTKSLRFCRLCSQMRFWMSLFSLGSSDEVRMSSRLVITSSISAGTGSSWILCRPAGMWCDAALRRIVQRIFSSLWQSVGRERLLRAASTSCLYLSQLHSSRTFVALIAHSLTGDVPSTNGTWVLCSRSCIRTYIARHLEEQE